MYTIDGKPACLFVTENLGRARPDGERHFYPAFVKAFELDRMKRCKYLFQCAIIRMV